MLAKVLPIIHYYQNIALRNQLEQLTTRVDNMSIHIVNLEKRLADDERDIEDLMKW